MTLLLFTMLPNGYIFGNIINLGEKADCAFFACGASGKFGDWEGFGGNFVDCLDKDN